MCTRTTFKDLFPSLLLFIRNKCPYTIRNDSIMHGNPRNINVECGNMLLKEEKNESNTNNYVY